MFSVVLETEYTIMNEIFKMMTWISVHKIEQKLCIEINKYVNIGFQKPNGCVSNVYFVQGNISNAGPSGRAVKA
jgi:hypothetical protein